jgi:hypothetical protein
MNASTWPLASQTPSVGSGAQMVVSAVTSLELVQTGGSPLAVMPKAKTVR